MGIIVGKQVKPVETKWKGKAAYIKVSEETQVVTESNEMEAEEETEAAEAAEEEKPVKKGGRRKKGEKK